MAFLPVELDGVTPALTAFGQPRHCRVNNAHLLIEKDQPKQKSVHAL
jgi:hypothetical protein